MAIYKVDALDTLCIVRGAGGQFGEILDNTNANLTAAVKNRYSRVTSDSALVRGEKGGLDGFCGRLFAKQMDTLSEYYLQRESRNLGRK